MELIIKLELSDSSAILLRQVSDKLGLRPETIAEGVCSSCFERNLKDHIAILNAIDRGIPEEEIIAAGKAALEEGENLFRAKTHRPDPTFLIWG